MKLRNILVAASIIATPAAFAGNDWSFKNVSVNWLDWSGGTETRTNAGAFAGKKDFAFLEVEGGFGGDWGEAYGFFDVENPTKGASETDGRDKRRYAAKAIARFNLVQLGGVPVQAYVHLYDARDHGTFFSQNRVLGLGTSLSNGNFWIKPFIGGHQQFDRNIGAHANGVMAGYVAGYSFQMFGQSFMATQWHETEFNRDDKFLTMGSPAGGVTQGNATGQNGAVSLWWNVSKEFTTGVQYRYADQKLGSASYQNAMIYTAKYNF
ncbi:outer membrane protein OmpK [Iodobacter fluviatilis]|uniref:Nucleoside-specific channel-forming protein Tsx n=1 Tax=Iodobacter fluviatilis TaxID=537 RepID=A0A377Q6M0_9NEIS|nr:outer membrane protein OmpK [Iodobacter fluviatilis]TCU89556.1 nucleoside-specific channel-forming protein Tsx [Iodobacter fluviatilis]STQ90926.1 Nucleoside-specific channel-forming protein, Tsx [Iodobacter fluviatilis]